MSLLSDLDALNEGHEVGKVPDEVTGRWPAAEAGSQVQANLVRINEGREIAARVDAAPRGQKQDEIDKWMARLGRSESHVRARIATARVVTTALHTAGEAGLQLDSSEALNCRFDQVGDSVRNALDLPPLPKPKKDEKPPPSPEEVAAAWKDEGLALLEDGLDRELVVAAAMAVIEAARERPEEDVEVEPETEPAERERDPIERTGPVTPEDPVAPEDSERERSPGSSRRQGRRGRRGRSET